MAWVMTASVREEAEAKIQEVKDRVDQRRSTAAGTYEHELLAKIVTDSLVAGLAIQREWFCDSVGMTWEDGDQETIYISRAPVAAAFTEQNVVHWTHWLGRLATQIREYIDVHDDFPRRLKYGPPHIPAKVTTREVGPWVRYQFTEGRLTDYAFRDATGTGTSAEPATPEIPAAEPTGQPPAAKPAPAFGLKDIVQLRDLAQDDQIRGPMSGVFILTGGPGVGKTSVALHRIPYLLLQQSDQLPAEVPNAPAGFFRAETMHVVVWKEHLVPYLQQCLRDLNFGNVPVHHVEDWIAKTLRDYVRIGKGNDQYQITQIEPDQLRRIKIGPADGIGGRWTGFTEQLMTTYLTGRDSTGVFHNPRADRVISELDELRASLEETFAGHPLQPQFRVRASAVTPTVAGIEAFVQAVRDGLDRLSEEITEAVREIKNPGRGNRGVRATDSRQFEQMRPVVTKARETVSSVRDRVVERLTADYPAVLADFYGSRVVNLAVAERFGQPSADEFSKAASERVSGRRLSQCDRYLLLWVIHILTRGAASDRAQARPIRQFSHTVVDEAQYYHPLVLRLLVDLALPPVGSVTIVGDLEQKVSSDGGLVAWSEAGIKVDAGKVFRLNTNYRWSQAVFAFLDRFRRLTGLRELKEPRRWASGAGLTPVIARCRDDEHQVSWLVDRISEVRRTDWSIAVVVPPSLGDTWRKQVIEELASCDIRSRWAVGEDVRECLEQVILTDYESIVGLEFDAVFLPGCDRVLSPPTPGADAVQAAWVALTRSRQFVAVSHIGPIAVFSDAEFSQYQSAAT